MPTNSRQFTALGAIYAQALINEAQKQNALEQITEDIRGINSWPNSTRVAASNIGTT